MTLRVQETAHDHIPEDFTIEGLKETFTDEEIEALTTGDDPILEVQQEQVQDDSAEMVADLSKTKENDGEDPDPDPEPELAAQPEPDPEPGPEPEAQQVEEPKLPEMPDISEHEEQIQKIDDELNSLLDEYNDGELTNEEFLEKQKTLVASQTAAQMAITDAENTVNAAMQTAEQYWFDRLDEYKKSAPELWSDEHLPGFDRHLKAVTGNAAYADMNRDAQIKLAHKLYGTEYEARTGQSIFKQAEPEPKSASQAASEEKTHKVRSDKRPDAPQTLAGLNSDTSAEVEDSTFAAFDRMIMKDPLRAEAMLEQMPDDQRDRLLNEV